MRGTYGPLGKPGSDEIFFSGGGFNGTFDPKTGKISGEATRPDGSVLQFTGVVQGDQVKFFLPDGSTVQANYAFNDRNEFGFYNFQVV